MRCIANWKARLKRMTSITPLARRGKPNRAGKSPWASGTWSSQEARARPGPLRQRPAGDYCLGQSSGAVVLQATRDFTVKTVQKAADIAVHTGSRLYTDSASSYRALKGYVHAFVNHTQKEYARGEVHENRAECLFSLLKPYLRVFRGVSKFNLQGTSGSFSSCATFVSTMPASRPTDLAGGVRSSHCQQGQKGRICHVF